MEDPCTSSEDLAKGTSAKHAERTPVVLKSVLPHETREPQDSLLLTPRPPIDGKPCECKQEVVDSIMTVGCMNGMVKLAEPTEITDIDRTPMLAGELAMRDCGVDEGDGTECKGKLHLLKIEFHCKESDQHIGNTNEDVCTYCKWTATQGGVDSKSKQREGYEHVCEC